MKKEGLARNKDFFIRDNLFDNWSGSDESGSGWD